MYVCMYVSRSLSIYTYMSVYMRVCLYMCVLARTYVQCVYVMFVRLLNKNVILINSFKSI